MNNAQDNAYTVLYPSQSVHNSCCGVNTLYQTIDPNQPFETTAVGPASVKHLYSGIPNYYPIQKITRPIGTLYSSDYFSTHLSGVGRGKRIGYNYKPYPLTDRNVRETREYADYILEYPDFREWTRYPVFTTTTLNNPNTIPKMYE